MKGRAFDVLFYIINYIFFIPSFVLQCYGAVTQTLSDSKLLTFQEYFSNSPEIANTFNGLLGTALAKNAINQKYVLPVKTTF